MAPHANDATTDARQLTRAQAPHLQGWGPDDIFRCLRGYPSYALRLPPRVIVLPAPQAWRTEQRGLMTLVQIMHPERPLDTTKTSGGGRAESGISKCGRRLLNDQGWISQRGRQAKEGGDTIQSTIHLGDWNTTTSNIFGDRHRSSNTAACKSVMILLHYLRRIHVSVPIHATKFLRGDDDGAHLLRPTAESPTINKVEQAAGS